MSLTTKHLTLQVLLLTTWIAIIVGTRTVEVNSQSSCGMPLSSTPAPN